MPGISIGSVEESPVTVDKFFGVSSVTLMAQVNESFLNLEVISTSRGSQGPLCLFICKFQETFKENSVGISLSWSALLPLYILNQKYSVVSMSL